MGNWFNTLNEALQAEDLLHTWDIAFSPISYNETRRYTTEEGLHISIYRDELGRYERPIHYTLQTLINWALTGPQRNLKMLITIQSNYFNMLLKCAAKRDVRYYLEAICLDIQNNQACASDGRRLFVCDTEQDSKPDDEQENILVTVKQLKKAPKSCKHVVFEPLGDTIKVTYVGKSMETIIVSTCEGRFPDINRLIRRPSTMTDTPKAVPHLNYQYLADYQSIIKMAFTIMYDIEAPEHCSIHIFEADHTYVVIPMRKQDLTSRDA